MFSTTKHSDSTSRFFESRKLEIRNLNGRKGQYAQSVAGKSLYTRYTSAVKNTHLQKSVNTTDRELQPGLHRTRRRLSLITLLRGHRAFRTLTREALTREALCSFAGHFIICKIYVWT